MFRVVPSPIIRSANTVSAESGICHTVMDRVKFTDKVYIKIRLKLQLLLIIYFIGKYNMQYITNNNCNLNLIFVYILSLNLTLSITVWQIPDAVDTVVCSPNGGWYQPKHVEQFPGEINCVTLHLSIRIFSRCTDRWTLNSYLSLPYSQMSLSLYDTVLVILFYVLIFHIFTTKIHYVKP